MILRIILIGFIIGMAYRFLARFVLPVFQLTKMTSDRLRQMERQMQEQNNAANVGTKGRPKPLDADYIDYEEVK
jgi:hypothetical protein